MKFIQHHTTLSPNAYRTPVWHGRHFSFFHWVFQVSSEDTFVHRRNPSAFQSSVADVRWGHFSASPKFLGFPSRFPDVQRGYFRTSPMSSRNAFVPRRKFWDFKTSMADVQWGHFSYIAEIDQISMEFPRCPVRTLLRIAEIRKKLTRATIFTTSHHLEPKWQRDSCLARPTFLWFPSSFPGVQRGNNCASPKSVGFPIERGRCPGRTLLCIAKIPRLSIEITRCTGRRLSYIADVQ
jgi:hypothetical protein